MGEVEGEDCIKYNSYSLLVLSSGFGNSPGASLIARDCVCRSPQSFLGPR